MDEERYAIRLTEKEWRELIGWTRNGNPQAVELADSVEKTLETLKAKQ